MIQAPQPAGPTLRLAELRKRGVRVGIISSWIGEGEARASMRARVKHLARIPRAEWDTKHFRRLSIPQCTGIYELKWKAEKKQFRVAGYDYKGFFVMVLGFTHKGNVYDPPGWKNTLKKNRKDVDNGNFEILEFEP